MGGSLVGSTVPRIFTPPLREITPETSMGFQVVEFAREILGVTLYPWQQWLLEHALELNPDGTYRFRRVIGTVARQNGKTKLLTVLAVWWLFVDAHRFPDMVAPKDFKVLGTAQNLDIARDSWAAVGRYCDPDDDDAVPALKGGTARLSGSHGFEALILKNKTLYEIRAANRQAGRGKSAARVIMDELREQRNWAAWAAISQTTKAVFNSQLWGISNAGDSGSVVLKHQRDTAIRFIEDWESQVVLGGVPVDEFTSDNNVGLGLFEWSAPPECAMDDADGILQANPSIGHGHITWESIRADREGMPERDYRTEVLCQWVTAAVYTYIEPREWALCSDPASEIVDGSPVVIGVDTSADRSMSYVSVAGYRADGNRHVETVAQRTGMLWVPDVVNQVAEKAGASLVVVQARGTPAIEFIPQMEEAGLKIFQVGGSELGSSTGQFRDHVKARTVFHRGQPVLDMAVSGGITKTLGAMEVWDRVGSAVDIASLVSANYALYGLEHGPELAVMSTAYGDDYEKWW